MDLLDRYLEAVQFWLPKAQRRDIIAELSEDLRSQIEEKESQLGRKLEDKEVAAILKRCGSPLAVATRYLPQQYLIGPTLFPLYRFVLAVVLAGCIIPRTLIWLGFLLAGNAHGGAVLMENIWSSVIFFAFFITLAFAIFERSGVNVAGVVDFNPQKLPPIHHPNRISRVSSLIEIAIQPIFAAWFVSLFWPRPTLVLYGVSVAVAPAWKLLFAGFMVLTLVNFGLSCMNLAHPFWTRRRLMIRLLSNAAGGVLFYLVLRSQLVLALGISGVEPEKAAMLTRLINSWLATMVPYSIAVLVAIVAVDIYRIVRLGRTPLAPIVGMQAGGIKCI
jgi:hypothetical protein